MLRFFAGIHQRFVVGASDFIQRNFGKRATIFVVAILVGAIAGATSLGLHALVAVFDRVCRAIFLWASQPETKYWAIPLFLCTPLIGMALSAISQKIFGGRRYAKSLSPLILNLSRNHCQIPHREAIAHVISSSLAVGFGGSAGLEAPSVLTGSAVGSNICTFLRLKRSNQQLLIGCGAAAAISAVFDSPIGGVLFVVEVLFQEFNISALIPMVISSASAIVLSRMLVSAHSISLKLPSWRIDAVPFYFLLGVISAVIGVYVIKMAYWCGGVLKSKFKNTYVRVLFSGISLCVMLALFPVLRGQGYKYVELLFQGRLFDIASPSPLAGFCSVGVWVLITVLVAIFLKVVTTSLTVDGGGDGGIFAPSMFIGAFLGFAFAKTINATGLFNLQAENFVVAGMCGVFTAVLRAPLTGVFLIAEVTGGYELFVPLMIVSATSWFSAGFMEPYSIYRKALADSNQLSENRDMRLLQRLPVRLSLNTNFEPLYIDDTVQKLTDMVENGKKHEVYPVLESSGNLIGTIELEKVLASMLNPELASSLLIFDLMSAANNFVYTDDDLAKAVAEMEKTGAKYIPVKNQNEKFVGFLYKQEIFAKYRRLISEV